MVHVARLRFVQLPAVTALASSSSRHGSLQHRSAHGARRRLPRRKKKEPNKTKNCRKKTSYIELVEENGTEEDCIFKPAALLHYPAAFVVALLEIAFTWWPLAPNPAALRCQQGALSEHVHAGSAMVLAHLKELAQVVTRYQAEPSRAKLLAGPVLCRMAVSRRGVERDLENLVRVGSALETLDALDFTLLRRRVALLPAHAQTEVRLQLAAERQRLAADKMESRLLRRVLGNTSGFAEALTKALSCLEQGRTGDARTKIIAALRLEQEATVLSAEIAARVARYQREAARIVARAHLTLDGARA